MYPTTERQFVVYEFLTIIGVCGRHERWWVLQRLNSFFCYVPGLFSLYLAHIPSIPIALWFTVSRAQLWPFPMIRSISISPILFFLSIDPASALYMLCCKFALFQTSYCEVSVIPYLVSLLFVIILPSFYPAKRTGIPALPRRMEFCFWSHALLYVQDCSLFLTTR
jgi:hypothetical protein